MGSHPTSMQVFKPWSAKFGAENVPAKPENDARPRHEIRYLVALRLRWGAVQVDEAGTVDLVCCNASVA